MLRRLMIVLTSSLLILFIGLFLLVRFLEHTSVFFPGKIIHSTPNQMGMSYEDLYIETLDGLKINAWLVKGSPRASIIIFAHGNAGTMGERIMKVKFWHDLGLNVLIFDYRGYGNSQGHPTEKGIYLDAQGAYDYLLTRKDIDHSRIVAYGASLGGVVMVDLATKRKLAALIVESTLTSAKDMARRIYPFLPTFMMGIQLDTISKIGHIAIPKLFIHSKEDRTVPFSMGKKLYQTACDPKIFLLSYGGHNDGILINDARVRNGFSQFLKDYSLL